MTSKFPVGTAQAAGRSGHLDTLFGALADPTRRRLIERLIIEGPATITALTGDGPLTRQAVTKHLRVLAEASLIVAERRGRELYHRAVPAALATAVGWLLDTAGTWDQRIDRLRATLPTTPGPATSGPTTSGAGRVTSGTTVTSATTDSSGGYGAAS